MKWSKEKTEKELNTEETGNFMKLNEGNQEEAGKTFYEYLSSLKINLVILEDVMNKRKERRNLQNNFGKDSTQSKYEENENQFIEF